MIKKDTYNNKATQYNLAVSISQMDWFGHKRFTPYVVSKQDKSHEKNTIAHVSDTDIDCVSVLSRSSSNTHSFEWVSVESDEDNYSADSTKEAFQTVSYHAKKVYCPIGSCIHVPVKRSSHISLSRRMVDNDICIHEEWSTSRSDLSINITPTSSRYSKAQYSDTFPERCTFDFSGQNTNYRQAWRNKNKAQRQNIYLTPKNISQNNIQLPSSSLRRIASIARSPNNSQNNINRGSSDSIKVFITGGTYTGHTGRLIKQTEKKTHAVMDGKIEPVCTSSDHMKVSSRSRSRSGQSDCEAKSSNLSITRTISSHSQQDDWKNNNWQKVDIVGGKYKGKSGKLIKQTDKRSQVLINGTNIIVYLNQNNISLMIGNKEESVNRDESEQVIDDEGVNKSQDISSCKHSNKSTDYDSKISELEGAHEHGGKYKVHNNHQHTSKQSNQKVVSYNPLRVESSHAIAPSCSNIHNDYVKDDMSYQFLHSGGKYQHHNSKTVKNVTDVKQVMCDDKTSVQNNSKGTLSLDPNKDNRTIGILQQSTQTSKYGKALPMRGDYHHTSTDSCNSTITSCYSTRSRDTNNIVGDSVRHYNHSCLAAPQCKGTWSNVQKEHIVKAVDILPGDSSKTSKNGQSLNCCQVDGSVHHSDNQYIFVDKDDPTYETCDSFPGSNKKSNELEPWATVEIIGGVHKGKTGTFIKSTPKRVQVIIDGSTFAVNLLPGNIKQCT
jgi:ribosomal protein L24